MKVENREQLIGVIGELNGLAYCVTGGIADVIVDVVETLEGILDDEKKGANEEK